MQHIVKKLARLAVIPPCVHVADMHEVVGLGRQVHRQRQRQHHHKCKTRVGDKHDNGQGNERRRLQDHILALTGNKILHDSGVGRNAVDKLTRRAARHIAHG